MKQAQESGALGSSSFKLQNDANRIRIVQGFLPHTSEFTDDKGKTTTNFKWLTRVIDRRDGKVKVFFLGHTIYKQLVALQQDSESGTEFDELPMPYDININAVGAGTLLAKYTVIPGKRTPLTLAEEAMVGEQDPLEDLQQALNKKKPVAPTGPVPFDPDEKPF